MRTTTIYFLVLLALSATVLTAAPVAASASFTGGLLGSWSFQYLSGAPDVFLQSIQIDLSPGTNLAFDTAPGGFGSLSHENVCCFAGTDAVTGLTSYTPPGGAALDGQTEVIFNFSHFAPGETFQFDADVDHPNPVLTPLNNCAGKSGAALALCLAQNVAIAADNAAKLLAAQTVLPNQIAGATVTFTFGGSGYLTTSKTGSFESLTVLDLLRGQTTNVADISIDVPTPEPASVTVLALGLSFLAVLRIQRATGRTAPATLQAPRRAAEGLFESGDEGAHAGVTGVEGCIGY